MKEEEGGVDREDGEDGGQRGWMTTWMDDRGRRTARMEDGRRRTERMEVED